MGAERATFGDVSPTGDNAPPPVTVRPAPRSASATQCPHRAALRASTISCEGTPPSNFNPTREYSTGNVVLFWQPPSIFPQWTSSALVVDDVSYSCAEQLMMAEKARLFHDNRALELILSTSEPRSHKRIGRSIRGFHNAIWERERENAVLAGTFAKYSQNPEMKHHLLGTVNKLLAEASPFDQVVVVFTLTRIIKSVVTGQVSSHSGAEEYPREKTQTNQRWSTHISQLTHFMPPPETHE